MWYPILITDIKNSKKVIKEWDSLHLLSKFSQKGLLWFTWCQVQITTINNTQRKKKSAFIHLVFHNTPKNQYFYFYTNRIKILFSSESFICETMKNISQSVILSQPTKKVRVCINHPLHQTIQKLNRTFFYLLYFFLTCTWKTTWLILIIDVQLEG